VSAILGIFTRDGHAPSDPVVRRMMGAMHRRGHDRVQVWRDAGALLAVARDDWELAAGLSGGVLVLVDEDAVVAADASIYYRDELRRAVERRGGGGGGRGGHVTGDSPSHLILAAYRAWGEDCAAHLEGDFAFIVWNRRTHRVCAARDFGGTRTLFYAEIGDTLVLASTVSGVLAHPECSSELDLAVIAATAGGMFAASHETCYRAIKSLPAAWTLTRREVGRAELRRHWRPPVVEPRGDLSFQEGGEHLRALLQRAVGERIPDRDGLETAVWLSGGWDSTAVFGAGQEALRRRGDGRALRAVSMSYPPGDPGREDELIQAVADFWGVPVYWLDIRDVPFFDAPAVRAADRDEPFAHPFEGWNRALARGAREAGARVALEGVGGDQLFQVSHVYLADLLRTGRWLELVREWRREGLAGTGFRTFFRWAVQPLLPDPVLALARILRGGRPLVGYLERSAPSWLDREFVRRHGLVERERAFTPVREGGSRAAYEMVWYLTYPYFPFIFGHVAGLAREEGVEIRSPLYDRRIIEFAVTRPIRERSSGPETKRLLRSAVQGLLPPAVLAPRATKTGLTSGYFARSMREGLPALCDEMLRSSVLVDAGIIDAGEFRRASIAYLRGECGDSVGANLYFTVQTELWLRARVRPADLLAGVPPVEPVVVTAGARGG
jgi:asparagine synthase (glutamine-hydrolysing)